MGFPLGVTTGHRGTPSQYPVPSFAARWYRELLLSIWVMEYTEYEAYDSK